jgi:hypothetical protein
MSAIAAGTFGSGPMFSEVIPCCGDPVERRICFTSSGDKTFPVLALYADWRRIHDPATIGEALDVPLNQAV